jgi:hypothetical protein
MNQRESGEKKSRAQLWRGSQLTKVINFTLLFTNLNDRLALICATLGTHMMRNMVLAAVFADDQMFERQCIMRAAASPAAA